MADTEAENSEMTQEKSSSKDSVALIATADIQVQTAVVQNDLIQKHETDFRRGINSLFDDQDQQSRVFDELQVAREALRKCCENFSAEVHVSKETIFKSKGKSAKARANEKMQACLDSNYDDVRAMVQSIESEWRQRHSKAYDCFIKVCNTLNSHKEIFSILPNQSLYASVFCGTLSVLVQAAVNHSSIAETLSRTLSELSSKVALCAKLQHVIKTNSMKRRLADVYTKLFNFFRDIMTWYLKSKTSRFFDSFNDNVNKNFEGTAQAIQGCIDEMYNEAGIAGLAMQRATLSGMSQMSQNHDERFSAIEASLGEVKAQLAHRESMLEFDFGPAMLQAFLSGFEKVSSTSYGSVAYTGERIKEISRVKTLDDTAMNRVQVCTKHLEKHIVGDSGLNILVQSKNLLVESNAKVKLEGWLSRDNTPQILWISGPLEPQHLSSARASSLAVVAASNSIGAPLISHFCEKPPRNPQTDGKDPERVGLIGLVYNLIYQLVNLNSESWDHTINEERFKALSGTAESWPHSISLLDDLLQNISCLQYCAIHGLNDLESGRGSEWCSQLIDIFLHRQQAGNTAFNLLFTTTGQSRVLSKSIPYTNRYNLTKRMREVERRGKRLNYPTRTVQFKEVQ